MKIEIGTEIPLYEISEIMIFEKEIQLHYHRGKIDTYRRD